jgi:beta-1,4-N-acetylglucosaminyltransferase
MEDPDDEISNSLPLLLFLTLLSILSIATIRFLLTLGRSNNKKKNTGKKQKEKGRTLVVLGSGGHTMEMIELIQELDPDIYDPIEFIIAKSDHTSFKKIQTMRLHVKKVILDKDDDKVVEIPRKFHVISRSREVGQSWRTTLISTLISTFQSIFLVLKIKPDLILCNGPGTCIPVCIGGFFLRWINCFFTSPFSSPKPKIVFIESFCRVKSLSLTGRMLYPFVDSFIVHWPELQRTWVRTEYLGVIF